jgi:hypothetical protein
MSDMKNKVRSKSGLMVAAFSILVGMAGFGCDGGGSVSGGAAVSIRPGAYETDSTVDAYDHVDITYFKFNENGTGTNSIRMFEKNKMVGYGKYVLADSSRTDVNELPLTWKIESDLMTIVIPVAHLDFQLRILSRTNTSVELVGVKATRNGVDMPVSGKIVKLHIVE